MLKKLLNKARELPVGTIRTHGGKKFQKKAKGKWVPVTEKKPEQDLNIRDALETRGLTEFGFRVSRMASDHNFRGVMYKHYLKGSNDVEDYEDTFRELEDAESELNSDVYQKIKKKMKSENKDTGILDIVKYASRVEAPEFAFMVRESMVKILKKVNGEGVKEIEAKIERHKEMYKADEYPAPEIQNKDLYGAMEQFKGGKIEPTFQGLHQYFEKAGYHGQGLEDILYKFMEHIQYTNP
jgi:hypothetical protein